MSASDDLDKCLASAVQALSHASKADLLLDSAEKMLANGRYGDEVETYFDVLLRTPGLSLNHQKRALSARGAARRAAGESLLAKADQDFKALVRLDPSDRKAQAQLRRNHKTLSIEQAAHRRLPHELWDSIAHFIPRYHLRQWLSVSRFYRQVAQRIIFRTVDLFFSEDTDMIHRVYDFFERIKADPEFALRIKTLRLHWAMEEGDLLDLLIRICRSHFPAFTGLQEFEWIGYPELGPECIQALQMSHPQLRNIGAIGWHFDAEGVSEFNNLTKFTLRAEDDDGFADMGEVRWTVDRNQATLQHLSLGASLNRYHTWDEVFESPVIRQLKKLDLVDTRISHLVLTRLTHAHSLRALTLHGTFDSPAAAAVIFGSDHIVGGVHTILPALEEFRCVLVGHDDEAALFTAIANFVRGRPALQRLDLGSCPWNLVIGVLPDLIRLRVLRIKTSFLSDTGISTLVKVLPTSMTAIHLSVTTSARPLSDYTHEFSKFPALTMLHLNSLSLRRPHPNSTSEKDFNVQTDAWLAQARAVAHALPALDFVGWHREHYIVDGAARDIKELPARRRLDCGRGVDLGTEDAAWLERQNVPLDYETPGLDCVS